MDYAWYDLVGNIGVLIILAAYLAAQLDRMDTRSATYSVLNAAGAGLITLSLCFDFNLSAFVIEVAWMLISLFGLIRRWRSPVPESAR